MRPSCYRTLFEASDIHHSNTGPQITHDIYINGFFELVFDLPNDRGASVGHTSQPEKGNIRIELKFNKQLPESFTCLLYLDFDNSVLVDFVRTVTTDFKWKLCRYYVHCVTSALYSKVFSPISYHNRGHEPPPSSPMPIPTQRGVHTGYPCNCDSILRVPTTLIYMSPYRSYPQSRRSSNATARPGTTTDDSCKS